MSRVTRTLSARPARSALNGMDILIGHSRRLPTHISGANASQGMFDTKDPKFPYVVGLGVVLIVVVGMALFGTGDEDTSSSTGEGSHS